MPRGFLLLASLSQEATNCFSDAQSADNQVPGWGNYFVNKATAYGT
jgi:hypothetical protein